jgi:cyanate lyase
MFYVYQLPVPRLTADDPHCRAIAKRVAKLVCVGQEFDELRRELLGSVEAHIATNPIERQRLQNEIDALVAHLYGLSEDELRHILYAPYTFPLVGREVKDGVMAAFARVGEIVREA